MAVDSNNHPHVVWTGYRGENYIYYSADLGAGWQTWPTLLSTTSHDNYDPRIAVDPGGGSHVVWYGYDENTGKQEIFYSTDAGGSWSEPDILSTTSNNNYNLQIALDPAGIAHVVWYGNFVDGDEQEIFYSTNAGGSWSEPDILSTTSNNNYSPQIALDPAGIAHVVWYGNFVGGGEQEVFYSINAGGSWSAPDTLSTTSNNNYNPQIALDPAGIAHVVWYGNFVGGGEQEAFYSINAGGSLVRAGHPLHHLQQQLQSPDSAGPGRPAQRGLAGV